MQALHPPADVQCILEKLSEPEVETLAKWIHDTRKGQTTTPRSYFSQEEDAQLLELVAKYGVRSWKVISSKMPGRTTRQCRERYQQYLSPQVSKQPWSAEEDELLSQKVAQHGPAWSLISHCFQQRTPVSLKNRWISLMRKGYRSMDDNRVSQMMLLDEGALSLTPLTNFDDIEVFPVDQYNLRE